jgi:hypothetical protein
VPSLIKGSMPTAATTTKQNAIGSKYLILIKALGKNDQYLYLSNQIIQPNWLDSAENPKLFITMSEEGRIDWTSTDSSNGITCPKYDFDLGIITGLASNFLV